VGCPPKLGFWLFVAWFDKFFVVCRRNIELCRICEEYERCLTGKYSENLDKKFVSCTMKMCHVTPPCTSAVCDDEPCFIHIEPPYLPELHPYVLCFFSRLKNGLKFLHFASLKDIQNTATAGPTAIASGMSRSSLPTEVQL